MHDRRIDGEVHTFGNAGALFMRAMTWWDHETESIWSQPWGKAFRGELQGVELFLLPSQLTTWASWKGEHPNTLVMINDLDLLGFNRVRFDSDFVIGPGSTSIPNLRRILPSFLNYTFLNLICPNIYREGKMYA